MHGWNRFLLWGLGSLVAIVPVVAIVGWTLPVGHTAWREVTVAAPADSVFALITGFADHPRWRTGVHRVEMLAPENGRTRFREHSSDGSILFEVVERQPARRLVTRIADPSLPFGGTWTYELTPDGDGTRLRITENGEVYNPIFRFVSRFVMGHTSTIDRYLEDVTRHVAR